MGGKECETGYGRGRPMKENSKKNKISHRISDEKLKKLDELCTETGLNRSEIMDKAFDIYYNLKIFGFIDTN